MKYCYLILLTIITVIANQAISQTISSTLPKKINAAEKFLFYLHGGVVTEKGNNGVTASMPQWGPYEYVNILDSLRSRGINIISENRRHGINDTVYVNKVVKQVDSLIRNGVPVRHIMILGASSGSEITLSIAGILKNEQMKYVIMGACWPDTYKYYQNIQLPGKFLSIVELTDPHCTCSAIFNARTEVSSFKEIELSTGLSHGFLFKGYKEWIDPIADWFNKTD